MLIYSFSYLS